MSDIINGITLLINEVEYGIAANTLRIDEAVEERTSCEFTIIDTDAEYDFNKGQKVELFDMDSNVLFGGIIHSVRERMIFGNTSSSTKVHEIKCADWHYLVDKRLAVKSYENADISSIVMDLWRTYLQGEGVRAYDYKSTVLEDNPLGYWRLNENDNATAYDSSGNGYHGTYGSGVARRKSALRGDPDGARAFLNEEAGKTTFNHSELMMVGEPEITVEFWFRFTKDLGEHYNTYPLAAFARAGFQGGYATHFANNNPGSIVFQVPDGAGYTGANATSPDGEWVLNEWYHFVGTFNRGTMCTYINGRKRNESTNGPATVLDPGISTLTLGGNIEAEFDELAVYTSELSHKRIMLHYLTGRQELLEYADLVQGDTPVGYWRFEDNDESSIAADSSGNGLDGTYENLSPSRTLSLLKYNTGHSTQLDSAQNQYIDCGNPTELQITGSQTIEFWCKPEKFEARRNPIAKAYGGEGTITLETNGTMNYYYGTSGDNTTPHGTYSSGDALSLNEVSHVVLVRDLAAMKVRWYINGEMTIEHDAQDASATASSLPFLIGAGYVSNFDGFMDEVAVYDYALNEDQILEHYLTGTRDPKWIDTGVVIEQSTINYAKVSEALDRYTEVTRAPDGNQFTWFVDRDRIIHFHDWCQCSGEFDLDANTLLSGSIDKQKDAPRYRNKQYVKGGRDLTDPQEEVMTGDNSTRSYPLGYPVGKTPTVWVKRGGGVYEQQSIGVKGVDEDVQWFWAKGDPILRQADDEIVLSSSDFLKVQYRGEFDVVVVTEDTTEVQRMAALEDVGSGITEEVDDATDTTGRTAAFQIAAGTLSRYVTVGDTISFETRRTGLAAGDVVNVNVPELGFTNEMMMITEIEAYDATGREVRWRGRATNGPVIGTWRKWFGKSATRAQTFVERVNIGENQTLSLLSSTSDTWGWTDTSDETVITCFVLGGNLGFTLC